MDCHPHFFDKTHAAFAVCVWLFKYLFFILLKRMSSKEKNGEAATGRARLNIALPWRRNEGHSSHDWIFFAADDSEQAAAIMITGHPFLTNNDKYLIRPNPPMSRHDPSTITEFDSLPWNYNSRDGPAPADSSSGVSELGAFSYKYGPLRRWWNWCGALTLRPD